MRPAHKLISAGRLDSSRAGCFHTPKPLCIRASEPGPSPALPFRRSQSDSQLLFIPTGGKVYLCQRNYMLETSRSKPPVKSCRNCLLRPERLNQRVSWKTATPDAREGSPSSKCLLRKKPLQLLSNSM